MRDLLKRWWFLPSILLVLGVGTGLPGTTVGGLDTLGNFHPFSVDSAGVLNVSTGGGSSGGTGGGAVFGPDAPGATPTNPPVLTAGVGADAKVHTVSTTNTGIVNVTGHIDGLGAAGTPAGQVVSVQGVSGGTTVPISGTVSISGGAGSSWDAGVVVTNVPSVQGQDGGYWLKVDGQTADGTATVGSPVLVGGWDGTLTHAIRVTAQGVVVNVIRTGMSPQVPTVTTLASGTSSTVSPLGAGACVRITCNVAVAFRTGTAPITAVLATDSLLQTTQPEMRFCLASTESAVAFITGNDGGGECRTSILNTP